MADKTPLLNARISGATQRLETQVLAANFQDIEAEFILPAGGSLRARRLPQRKSHKTSTFHPLDPRTFKPVAADK
jgi:hypothetical protein